MLKYFLQSFLQSGFLLALLAQTPTYAETTSTNETSEVLEDLIVESERLTKKNKTLENFVKNAELALQIKNEEIARLNNELAKKEQGSLQRSLNQYSDEIPAEWELLKTSSTSSAMGRSQYQDQLRDQVKELKEMHAQRLLSLQDDLEKMTAKKNEEINALKNQLNQSPDKKSAKESAKESEMDKVDERNEVRSLKKALREKEAKAEDTTRAFKSLEEQIDKKQKEVTALTRTLDGFRKEKEEEKQEAEERQRIVSEDYKREKEENQRLNHELADLREDAHQWPEIKATHLAKINELTHEVDACQKTNLDISGNAVTWTTEKEKMQREIAVLQRENEELKSWCESTMHKKDDAALALTHRLKDMERQAHLQREELKLQEAQPK